MTSSTQANTEADYPLERKHKVKDRVLYRRLLGYVADQKSWFALALVGFLLAAGGEVGFAKAFGLIIDGLDQPAPSYIWLFPAAMLSLAALRAFGSVAGDYTLSRISFHAIHVVRSQLFERLLLMPSTYYDKSTQGHLVSRLTYTAAQLRDTTTDALKVLVSDGLKVLVFLGFLIYQNWLLTLAFGVVAPLVGAIVHFASHRFRSLSERIQSSMGDVTHAASEAVSGHREIKVFGGERYERDRFVAASEQNRRQNLKMSVTKALSAQVIQFLAAAGLAGLVCLIFLPGVGGSMTPGDLAAYLGVAGMLANPLKKLADLSSRLQKGLAAAEDIFEQLDEAVEEDDGEVEVERVRGAIRFEDVAFAYGEDRQAVLRDVTLTIEPGQTVALVGRSGAGKTTLASLIARFYQADSGRILLDDVPLQRYRLSCLRRQIAFVTQDVTLFNDTLANNIAYGGLADASEESIREAVKRAHAADFVDELPDGLQTLVGDDGVLLSGGQRQRVAIARALLKDAPVLILDEATSSLDAVSERQVQAALEEVVRGRTTIVIAHRLSTVENADVIAVVDDGRVAEVGDHRSLLAARGIYAELYETQFENGGELLDPAPAPLQAPPSTAAGTLMPLVDGWYDGRFWPRLLWPLGALFGWLAGRRRRRFLSGRAHAWRAPLPVVVVGNITVGGTGKTPLVIWLAKWLAERGMKPGVVTRGYGGKAKYPLLATAETPASLCGDEAALIARRAECPVIVDPDRTAAVRALIAGSDVDIVLADDGLQHYRLHRNVEIAVVDGLRGVGNGLCLPAGPLREPLSRLRECHWIVANGAATGLVARESVMVAEATAFVHLATGERLAPAAFAKRHANGVLALAAIGNPQRFQATLANAGIPAKVRAFPDHHRFRAKDLEVPSGSTLVVTEKDAEKIKWLPVAGDWQRNCWHVEIEMRFAAPVDALLTQIFAARGIDLPQAEDAEPRSVAQTDGPTT